MISKNFSNSSVSSLQDIIHNDSVRYSRKGYGIIIAFALILLYFLVLPGIVKVHVWPYVLLLQNSNLIYFLTFYLMHEIMFITGNLIMWVIYVSKIPFLERYRVNPSKPWPWEEDSTKWNMVINKTLKSLLITHLVLVPVATGLEAYLGVPYKISIEQWPSALEMTTQIIFFMLCEDFSFYWGHRILHHKSLYPKIHKIHHEYNNPISLSSEYAHPIEFLFVNLLPNAVGAKILGGKVHLITYIFWLIIRVMETLDGHSGYEFSWSPFRLLPLSGSANYHNYHHTHNDGNYGSFFMIWDTLLGTNKNYWKYLSNREKEELNAKKND